MRNIKKIMRFVKIKNEIKSTYECKFRILNNLNTNTYTEKKNKKKKRLH